MKNTFKPIFLALAFALVLSSAGFTGYFGPVNSANSVFGAKEAIAQTYYPYYQNNGNVNCYTFNSDLQVGSTGTGVEALHAILAREGFTRANTWASNSTFTEETASLVSGFQQKYRSEILRPSGLQYGTGFVGTYTRTKLNSLNNSYNNSNNCSGNDGGGGNNGNYNNIIVSVIPNKTTYAVNEDITFTIRAKNNSYYAQTIGFNNGCQTSYKIGSYDSAINQICTLSLGSIQIPGYGTHTWTVTHRPSTSSYNLQAGTYTLTGRVSGVGEGNATIYISGNSGGGTTGTNYPKVTRPNGGETLRRGSYQMLSWNMPNVTYNQAQGVNVSLIPQNYYGEQTYYPYTNYGSTCAVGSTCAYNSGTPTYYDNYYYNQYQYHQYASSYTILQRTYLSSFNWYVGSTPNSWSGIPAGTYKLQVCTSGTSNCDLSDNYFSIY